MSLENYWKVLADPAYKKAKWSFYSNGCFAVGLQDGIRLFDNEGHLLLSLPQGSYIHDMSGGWLAIKPTATNSWKFYNKQNVFVAETSADNTPLHYGKYRKNLPSGETYLVSLATPETPINLGYGVRAIEVGQNGTFAYSQTIRRQTIWHLCKEKDGVLVKNEPLVGVIKIEILADGSYVLYGKNNATRVFNHIGQRVFSCNYQKTDFRIVGNQQFVAFNGKGHRGVYSSVDGRLLLPEHDIDIYWDDGSYYSPSMGFVVAYYNGFLSNKDIYHCRRFTDELAVVWYKGQPFVLEVAQPLNDLRRQICNIRLALPADETVYNKYLAKFLLMIV